MINKSSHFLSFFLFLALFVPPAHVQAASPTTDCANLWENGFPLQAHKASFPCRFEGEEAELGVSATFYTYQEGWSGTGVESTIVALMKESFHQSVLTFKKVGQIPPITFVYTGKFHRDEDGDGNTIALTPVYHFNLDYETCPIIIYDFLTRENAETQKQIISHEIFHCFQRNTFPDQTLSDSQFTSWWEEGTAEFFSNLAYPTVNYEHRMMGNYRLDLPLFHKDQPPYATASFFQFLGGLFGDPKQVIHFVEGLPGGHITSVDEVQEGVAGSAGMMPYFHQYAEKLTSGNIQDSGGGKLPLIAPDTKNEVAIEANETDSSYDLETEPFTMTTKNLSFNPGGVYKIHLENMDFDPKNNVRVSVRPVNSKYSNWKELLAFNSPAANLEIDASCGKSPTKITALMTSGSGQPGIKKTNLKVSFKAKECECKDDLPLDPCLVGMWSFRMETLPEVMRLMGTGAVFEILKSSGLVHLRIDATKEVKVLHQDFEFVAKTLLTSRPIHITIGLDGQAHAFASSSTSSDHGKSMCLSSLTEGLTVKVKAATPEGMTVFISENQLFDGFGGKTSDYQCTNSSLTLFHHRVDLKTGAQVDVPIQFEKMAF